MSHLLQIAEIGNPILFQKTQQVDDVLSVKTQELIDDMITTVQSVGGVGIAAPQVSVSQQILIVACHPTKNRPFLPNLPPFAVINPKIISHSEETNEDYEGCLSVLKLFGKRSRWKTIEVQYLDRENTLQQKVFDGFLARIIQHEYDHLQGELFLNKVSSLNNLYSEREYQNLLEKNK
jgi:peptide deformylase